MEATKTEAILQAAIEAHTDDRERVSVLEQTRRFKRSWIDLAQSLLAVRERESWRRWGHKGFDDYCQKELHLKQATVDKLCASYGFLRSNAPKLARNEEAGPIPSWDAVHWVARAEERGAADDRTLAEMKRAVFEEGALKPALERRYREVAFPVEDEEKRTRLRAQILATARKLAELVADSQAQVPRALAEEVEVISGELTQVLSGS